MADTVSEWSAEISRQVAGSTFARYIVSLGQLAPMLDGKRIDQIDKRTIEEIVAFRRKSGASTATIRRDLSALSSVLTFAADRDWREGNPARDRMGRIRERRDPIVLPSVVDVSRVAEKAPGMLGAMIRFALLTGMRQEEIASLEWREIDGRTVTIVGKGSKRRTIEISHAAAAVIASLPRRLRCNAVFWHGDGEGGGRRYQNVASRFASIVAAVGKTAQRDGTEFRRFRFDDLRHRFAVDYLGNGGSIYDLQRHLGHSSIKVTEIYLAHLTPEQERSARSGRTAGGEVSAQNSAQ